MSKVSIGIDITDKDIKMVSLTKKGANYLLTNNLCILRNDLEDVKKLFQNPILRQGIVRFSMHDGTIKIKTITIPKVPEQELQEMINWTVKDALKIPLESYTIRYYPLGETSEKQQSYLALAIDKKKIQNYLLELQQLGITNPQWIEPPIQALTNCVIYNYELKDKERFGIIHLDSHLAYYGVVSSEGLLFYRTFAKTDETSDADLAHFFSKLSIEVQYSCESYNQQFPNQSSTQIILSGENAYLPGLQESIFEATNIPSVLLNPFQRIQSTKPAQAQYGIAVGLAL